MKKIIIKQTAIELARYVGNEIFSQVKKKNNSVLCLATGSSVIRLYQYLYENYKKQVSFNKVKTFNLDEYYGLSSDHSLSYRYFMQSHLFNHIDIKNENINFLNGRTKNIKKECNEYEKKICQAGGIDLAILGIGVNGHIAFIEPGTSNLTTTSLVKLSKETIKQNSDGRFFRNKKDVPKEALSMGILTILQSKKIILIANGRRKAIAISKAVNKKVNPRIPASYLQNHNNVIYALDKYAASEL